MNPDTLTYHQEGPVLIAGTALDYSTNHFEFYVRYRDEFAASSHESYQARERQNLKERLRLRVHTYKHVTRENWRLNKLGTITPTPDFQPHGCKRFEGLLAQRGIHFFLALVACL